MKKFTKTNGTEITIDDNGIATVRTPVKKGVFTIDRWDGHRYPNTVIPQETIWLYCNGTACFRLSIAECRDWLVANWPVVPLPKGWYDFRPDSIDDYNRWLGEHHDWRINRERAYMNEKVFFDPEPVKPILGDDARAWLYIDDLCLSDWYGKYSAGGHAKEAVVSGKMTLVEAAKTAKQEVEDYTMAHIWDD